MRRAFTLVELLVVIAIIGILVSITLPAVQYARESGRRSQCQNNLRQQALAMQAFHDANAKFPAALIHSGRAPAAAPYCGPEACYKGQPYVIYNHAGFVAILPFIEQGNLHRLYDYGLASSVSSPAGLPVAAWGNLPVYSTRVRLFECPSDATPMPWSFATGSQSEPYEANEAMRSNYLLSAGTESDASLPWAATVPETRGAFGNNGSAKIATFTDGTSRTILIGESKQRKVVPQAGPFWGCGTESAVHGSAAFTPNFGGKLQQPRGFGSFHSQITLFAFADGSVSGVNDAIALPAFAALTTPEGGEFTSQP